ncbi:MULTISPECIES: energy transducer TonB [Acinetobacter]|uniref:energy transducer TonB n=1 Tax=Acinetobacter TaxID=469 RepID=UPI00192A7C73|nr:MULTISPECIES: energy transducer TonB [Acinetobacter]
MKPKSESLSYAWTSTFASRAALIHSYPKSVISLLVIALHLLAIWFLSHFIEPYSLATSPKVNALKVHFVSLSPAEQESPHTSAQIARAQPPAAQQVKLQSTRPRIDKQDSNEQKILLSHNASHSVSNKQLNKQQHADASPPTQPLAVQTVENKTAKSHLQTEPSSAAVNSHQQIPQADAGEKHELSGGVKAPAAQLQLSRAPDNQIERDAPMQVSHVEVLSFGKFAYDDRELRQQTRMVELRLHINENGQPIDIQLKQSSGIASLDQRVLNAARQSRFKPYTVNGRTVAIVVDFPVQLKLSRDR